MPTKITPNLWFDKNAEEAAEHYVSIFRNSRIVAKSHYPEGSPGEAGTEMTVAWEPDGTRFARIKRGPPFAICVAVSLPDASEDQEEVDYYREELFPGRPEGPLRRAAA